MTLDIGMHDAIPADDYHSDPALSSGIAKLLIDRSPAHAWTAHPSLNPAWEREVETKFDIGTAAHKLLLEGEDCMAIFLGKDWRTEEAKTFAKESRDEGKIPLLAPQAECVMEMVEKAKMQFSLYEPDLALFRGGKPEQTIVWRDDYDVLCRARIDWLHDETCAVDDYKTTTASADPRKWERTMYGMGADVQVAFYLRGLSKTVGREIGPHLWRFVVQESYPPYAMSVVSLAPSAYALAQDKVQTAINYWAECLDKDYWPAYPVRVSSIEVPTWEEMRWLDKQGEEE